MSDDARMPAPRMRASDPNLSTRDARELGLLMVDLTSAALHRDADVLAELIRTLDPQEGADVIAGLAVGCSTYLLSLAQGQHGPACARLAQSRHDVADGRTFG